MTGVEVNYFMRYPNKNLALSKKHTSAFRKYYKITFEDVQMVYITKEREFSEKGYTLWGYDKENSVFGLEHSWFSQNYKKNHTKFYNNVLNATNFTTKYKLPVGDARRDNSFYNMPITGPALRYLQHNEEKCAIYSLASALYNIGDNKMCKFISKLEPTIDYYVKQKTNRNRNTAFTYIVNAMTRVTGNPTVSISKYKCTFLDNEERMVAWLLKNISINLRLVQVTGTHAMTISGSWIFDSNHAHALPLTQHWINWCSSIHEGDMDLKTVISVTEFHLPKKFRKEIMTTNASV